MIKMEYTYTEAGFCRVHYRYQNTQNEWVQYCIMEDRNAVKMYRCSKDNEPWYVVVPAWKDLNLEPPPDEYGKELYDRFLKGE
jgi:hypothetical protein